MSNDVIELSRQDVTEMMRILSLSNSTVNKGLVDKLDNLLGGWKPFSYLLPADPNALIELKSGSSTLLAFQVRAPGKSARLAYVSMQESGIDWVDPEDVDGWREYKYEES